MTDQEPLACWEKQLLTGDVFLCALPTGHDGDCQPYDAATGPWIPIGSTDAVTIQFIAPPDTELVIDLALWERARSVTFPVVEMGRIARLLGDDPLFDPDVSEDAARWSPDDGVTW